jgi:hypothetical protein
MPARLNIPPVDSSSMRRNKHSLCGILIHELVIPGRTTIIPFLQRTATVMVMEEQELAVRSKKSSGGEQFQEY